MKKLICRIYIVLPVCLMNIMLELDRLDFKLYFGSGQIFQLIFSTLSIVIAYACLEYFFNKKIKNKITGEEKNITSINALASVTILWCLLFISIGYSIVTSRTSYGKWSNGVSSVKTLEEDTNTSKLDEIRTKLEDAIVIARSKSNQEMLNYTLEMQRKFEKKYKELVDHEKNN